MLEKEYTVERKHSAAEVGSGHLNVLSTPAMIGFMEHTAKELADSELKEGETTVGIEVNIQHIKATAIGKTVTVKATLTERKKNILFYQVEAYEQEQLIGKGEHKRAIVDADAFMEKL
ncbi:MAG TPA: thioesterase family protein [Atopostipes sp.]|nr:thioesterase family protein [Atopostipes sp.]